MAALTFAAQAGQAVMQHQAANAQADATEQGNRIAAQQTQQALDERRNEQVRQMQQQYEQDASQANQHQLDAMRTQATMDTLLGEFGAAGGSADRRLATLSVRQGQDLATLRSNATKSQQEISMGARSDLISIANAGASQQRAVARPSLIGTGLTIAGAALQYGDRKRQMDNPMPRYGNYYHLEDHFGSSMGSFMRSGSSGD